MKHSKINSVRALARELGVSHSTVSDALRNNPRVSLKTRERVQKAAQELRYKYNSLAGTVMSKIKKSSIEAFRGVVVIVDLVCDSQRPLGATPYHRQMLDGAKETADRLGFKVDHFILGEEEIPIPRLNEILESRGIMAALFLPVSGSPNISNLNWEHLSGVYADYLIDLGYKRPGLVFSKSRDRQLQFRWEAAFSSYWS